MEIGLTGHLPLPSLALERPGPLHHLLMRLKRAGSKSEADRLHAVLDSLEFLERYFASVASGLVRKFEDPPELASLVSNSGSSLGLRRLLRYALNRLEAYGQRETVRELLACFFVHSKRSLPFPHARWLGLAGGIDEAGEQSGPWSYDNYYESLIAKRDDNFLKEANSQLIDILRSWIEGASAFFEGYRHFARLDQYGWQCTIQKDDIFIELVPPIPARLIPVEAEVPMTVPQTEDESFLFEEQNPYYKEDSVIDNPFELELQQAEPAAEAESNLYLDTIVEHLDGKEDSATKPLELLESVAQPAAWANPEPNSYPSWSASELKSFDSVLREVYPKLDLERVPRDYFNTVNRFLSSVSSGYIIIEGRQGAGKTIVAEALCDYLSSSSLDVIPLHFSVKNEFYSDSTTFLEQLNEYLRVRTGATTNPFEALNPQVIKSLNLRTDRDTSSSLSVNLRGEDLSDSAYRFSSYLSELKLVNDARLVLILDGIDEGAISLDPTDSLFRYLPPSLPEGTYVVLTYNPDRCRPNDREILEAIHLSASTEILLSPDSSTYRDLVERFLNWGPSGPLSESLQEALIDKSKGRLATAQHMLDGLRCQLFEGVDDLPLPEQIYERLFDRLYARVPDRYLELFLLLATSDDPVRGDELSYLGISRLDALELVHSLPSLFHCRQERNFGLSLAHRAIRLHLQRTFLASYALSCLKLGRRALHRMSGSDITILPVREDLDRLAGTVRRLLRWAYDSGDIEFLSEVSRDEVLASLRRRIFSAMEDRGLHHRKALLLSTVKRGFEKLLLGEGKEEFREELAWSLSSRALCYYYLGHYGRALVDIQRAISHFQTMVNEQGLEAKRNGLAAAFNRRSEIHSGMEDWRQALTDADLAVANYEVVVNSGRDDLFSLFMLAYHNRALVNRKLKRAAAAESDLSIALNGYLLLVDRDNRRDLRPQLAAIYQTRAALLLDGGNVELALASIASAIELYEVLVNQENFESLRNELASAYNDRGTILFRSEIYDEAERDYASTISIRTYLVAEGRIDVRIDLAKTYANRSLCLMSLQKLAGARESADRAVEILDRLIEEEGRDDLYADRAFALSCRGEILRQTNDIIGAREDLFASASDYRMAVVSQSNDYLHMQARVLSSLAEVALSVGDWQDAQKSSERALQIYDQCLGLDKPFDLSSERASAYYNLGESLRMGGEELLAGSNFQKAIDLFTQEVEEKGRPQLIGALASALFRFAQLDHRSSEQRLRLVSKALAFWAAASKNKDRIFDSLVLEALLLRAEIYKKIGSSGLALDDVSKVVGQLEEVYGIDSSWGGLWVQALLERSVLFLKLNDTEAALLDLDRAWEITVYDQSTPEESEFQRCLILLERVCLNCSAKAFDFSQAVSFFRDFFTRLSALPLAQFSLKDIDRLKERAAYAFKDLRYAALMPTRKKDYEVAVDFISELLHVVEEFSSFFTDFLGNNIAGGGELGQSMRLRTQRAWALFKQGKLLDALGDFETVVSKLPKIYDEASPDMLEFIAEIESGYAVTLDSLQRPEEALGAYGRAIEAFSKRPESMLSPRRAACLSNRARLLSLMGRYDEALADIEPSIEIAESNYQKTDLIAGLLLKAGFHHEAGDDVLSLHALHKAASWASKDGGIEPQYELPIRLGIFRRSADETERLENLKLALVLLKQCLGRGLDEWRSEAVRIFAELPYPINSPTGVALEIEISQLPEVLLRGFFPGYSPLTESLLRRAAKLADLVSPDRSFRKLSAAYYCMATKLCLLEFEKYGRTSLSRLVRCYVLTALSLVSTETPRQVEGMGEGIKAIANAVLSEPPDRELEVEINNMARLWLGLPPSKVLQSGVSRADLQKLRRW